MRPESRVTRALANPFGWIAFQVLEILVFGVLFRAMVPGAWSRAARAAIVLPILLAVVAANYRIRRRLPPFWEPEPGSKPHAPP